MSMLHTPPRLVRMQDRLTLSAEAGPTWRINERTVCLEARCGLSYTGVRPYRTANGIMRVLRRPEQVNSPGHIKTLRRLPGTDGHPADDVDVSPANYDSLVVGWGGDLITIEEYNGYPRPVGDVSVMRPGVIASMVDEETWAELRERWPEEFAGVTRAPGDPRTGTSLGYNALWYGPQVDVEIKSERDDGSLVGEWAGPHGPEEYDIEHYIDPDCEVVRKLAESTDFDPKVLGGQHIALNLERLGGRGAHQSELMRVVDSRELVITGDHARSPRPLALQVPCRVPIVSSSDHETPEEISADESAHEENMTIEIVKQKITVGVGRDNRAALSVRLAKRGIAIPASVVCVVDEVDAEKFVPALESVQGIISELLAQLTETEDAGAAEVAAKEEEMGDMLPKAEAEELVKVKEEELAAAQEALKSAADAVTKLTADNAKLDAALAPLRDAELARLRTEAVTLGADKVQVDAAKDALAVKRLVVTARLGDTFAKASDAAIDLGYDMALKSTPPPAKEKQAGRDGGTAAGAGLGAIPPVTLVKPRDEVDPDVAESTTADDLAASMGALG